MHRSVKLRRKLVVLGFDVVKGNSHALFWHVTRPVPAGYNPRIESKQPRIILASASPRRLELLAELVSDFEVIPSHIDETVPDTMSPEDVARSLAEQKANEIYRLHPDAIVVGADTVVAFRDDAGGWVQLAKPEDREDAVRMLGLLSGRSHIVITGFAVVGPGFSYAAAETTAVTFRPLGQAEIEAYVATGEPMDKAGGYAIQGGAKGFVVDVEGSLSNVIGLPLEALAPILQRSRLST